MNNLTAKKAFNYGVLLNVVSMLFSGIAPILNKFSLTKLNPMIGGFLTSIFASIFIAILIWITKSEFKIIKNKAVLILGITNGIGVILQYLAISLLSPVTVTLIARTYLIYIFILSYIFLKEKLGGLDYLAIIICLMGSVLISLDRLQFDNPLGIICSFIYPFMFAANNIAAKYLVDNAEAKTVLLHNHIISAIFLLICGLFVPQIFFSGIQVQAVAFNFFAAFFNGFLALLLFYYSLKFISAGKANIIRALGPIISILESSIFFPVQITTGLIMGTLLLITSTTLVIVSKNRQGD